MNDCEIHEVNLRLPSDWRKFHLENVRAIRNRVKVLEAVAFLSRDGISKESMDYLGRGVADR